MDKLSVEEVVLVEAVVEAIRLVEAVASRGIKTAVVEVVVVDVDVVVGEGVEEKIITAEGLTITEGGFKIMVLAEETTMVLEAVITMVSVETTGAAGAAGAVGVVEAAGGTRWAREGEDHALVL